MSGDRDVVVLGVGLHPFGRFPDRPLDALARHAALAALDDAGMAFDEIEAGFVGRVGGTGPASYASVMVLNVVPSAYAMRGQRHMAEFGTKPEHFAQFSVKTHRNAMENPYAQYRIAITLEEVLASRMVCDPLTLYQCC